MRATPLAFAFALVLAGCPVGVPDVGGFPIACSTSAAALENYTERKTVWIDLS